MAGVRMNLFDDENYWIEVKLFVLFVYEKWRIEAQQTKGGYE